MNLNGTTESLTIVMSGAAASINPTYLVKQSEGNGAPLDAVGTLNGATAVVPLTGEAGPTKVVDSIIITNSDTAAVTITINKKISSTSYPLIKNLPLAVGSVLTFDGTGYRVTDITGGTITTSTQLGRLAVQSASALGTSLADAAALIEGFNVIAGANTSLGVRLPDAVPGMRVYVKGVTTGALKVWPGGATVAINAIAAGTNILLANSPVPAIFIASSATQWYTLPLLPS
jgi:hypothetical protein